MSTPALNALRLSAAALCCAAPALLLPAPAPARAPQARTQTQVASAPAEELERGRALLKAGDAKGAARVFQAAVKARPADAEAWYNLGITLTHGNDQKGARKAFERSVKLRPDFAPARSALAFTLLALNKTSDALREAERALALDPQAPRARYVTGVVRLRYGGATQALADAEAAIKGEPDFAPGYLLKSEALLLQSAGPAEPTRALGTPSSPDGVGPGDPALLEEEARRRRRAAAMRYKEAADSLEKFLQLAPAFRAIWGEQLESLRVYARYAEEPDHARTIYSTGDASLRKAVITRKPEPAFTEQARKNGVSGLVRLRAVLDADGKVKHILVLRGLPEGLSEMAVRAARRIEFLPAVREGRPVAQYVTLEYNFNIY